MILPPSATERRNKLVGVRVTPSMYEMLNEQAKETGISVSQYIYKILVSFFIENNTRARVKYERDLLTDYYITFIKNTTALSVIERLHAEKQRLSKDFNMSKAREIFAKCAVVRDFSEFKNYIDKNDTKLNYLGSICDR